MVNEKKQSWSTIDMAIRQCHDFIIEAHRHSRNGCPQEGLNNSLHMCVAAITLKKTLEKIIE